MPAENRTVHFESCFSRICDGVTAATNGSQRPRTQVHIAEILGIRQSSISDSKRRGAIPSDWLLTLQRKHGLNPDWIEFGVGGMFVVASDSAQQLVIGEQELARIREAATGQARASILAGMTFETAKGLILDLLPTGATVEVHFNQSWSKSAVTETTLEQ